MGQSCSAVQDGDWFSLFVELQLLMDLKRQIVFISMRETERERSMSSYRGHGEASLSKHMHHSQV